MRVVIHSAGPERPPEGIWWEPIAGEVRSFYIDPTGPTATLGNTIMAQNDPKERAWGVYFKQLAEQAPYFSLWEDGELDETVTTPEKTLVTMRERWRD